MLTSIATAPPFRSAATAASCPPEEESAATGLDGDGASDAAEESGAAYVYTRSGDTWNFTSYVKASNTEVGDAFGTSVGISGAYFVVGARRSKTAARHLRIAIRLIAQRMRQARSTCSDLSWRNTRSKHFHTIFY